MLSTKTNVYMQDTYSSQGHTAYLPWCASPQNKSQIQKSEILQSMFSDHKGIELEISNNTLLNPQQKDITREIRKHLAQYANCGLQLEHCLEEILVIYIQNDDPQPLSHSWKRLTTSSCKTLQFHKPKCKT